MTYVSMVYAITRRLQPTSTLFPYTTLFRSDGYLLRADGSREMLQSRHLPLGILPPERFAAPMEEYPVQPGDHVLLRSEEHTSELQSRPHLVCRLLLEKKKTQGQVHACPCSPDDIREHGLCHHATPTTYIYTLSLHDALPI